MASPEDVVRNLKSTPGSSFYQPDGLQPLFETQPAVNNRQLLSRTRPKDTQDLVKRLTSSSSSGEEDEQQEKSIVEQPQDEVVIVNRQPPPNTAAQKARTLEDKTEGPGSVTQPAPGNSKLELSQQ